LRVRSWPKIATELLILSVCYREKQTLGIEYSAAATDPKQSLRFEASGALLCPKKTFDTDVNL